MANLHHKINYIEFGAKNIPALKEFYGQAFHWTFKEYGPDYLEFNDGAMTGGFNKEAAVGKGSLVILYSDALEETRKSVQEAGGTISQDIYAFPGGRRFHFTDPDGNELAVWSEK